ncbi:MAG: ABC transporter permease [Planctomycetota bacterium]|jgi:putative ABC transport system permease protein
MTLLRLVKKSLSFYWRTNLAVFLAVVVSTAVLAGALVVGDSVKNSLEMMVKTRLGNTQLAMITQDRFFTTGLASKLSGKLHVPVAPVLQLRGLITNSDSSKRANRIELLGVDDRFYKIAEVTNPFSHEGNSGVILNEPLAAKIGVKVGDEVMLRMHKPSLMPREIVLTPESDLSFGLRLTVTSIAGQSQFGRFSLRANQVSPLNVFVPLEWLQEQLNLDGQVNMLLVGSGAKGEITAGTANKTLQDCWELADAGLELRALIAHNALEMRSSRVFIDDSVGETAMGSSKKAAGVLTYFVNELRAGQKTTPYSMVTAMSKSSDAETLIPMDMKKNEIIINQWLADDLGVKETDVIEADYFVVSNMRKLREQTSTFHVRAIVPIKGPAADSELMPDFPGLAEADNCRDWKPGIPIDLNKIREKDEGYWDRFRGTPKAFVTLEAGQKMWGNRYGNLTAVRYQPKTDTREKLARKMLSSIEPASLGLYFQPVQAQGVKASGEGTDFGQLFIGFSMFLIAAALVLVGLLFVFGVEKRSEQVGMLLAVGFKPKQVRWLFLIEGIVLAIAGTIAGTIAGLFYTKAIIYGFTGLWRVAVSGSTVVFYVKPTTLLKAALSGVAVSVIAIRFALRKQLRNSPRQLLDNNLQWNFFTTGPASKGRFGLWSAAFATAGATVLLIVMGTGRSETTAGAFFGAGALLLVAGISLVHALLRIITGSWRKNVASISGLGVRNSTRRSGRSLAVVTMLASGVFLVIAIGANRHDPLTHVNRPDSGTGGFTLFGESAIGILHDLNSSSGRKLLALDSKELADISMVQLRVHDGDDASCFNLNRAQQPRLLGVEPEQFLQRKAFLFTKTIKVDETNNWNLLNLDLGEDVVAAIGDEATVKWALGKSIRDEIEYADDKGQKFRLRLVAMLKNSILQGSLLIAEDEFIRRFPTDEGHRMLLVKNPEEKSEIISETLSERLKDFGLEITTAKQRLAAFSAVENTYLSIFQLLGSLGLILGSIGLGIVVLRNVLDRRGELAMLRAIGFDKNTLKGMVFYEHAGLMLCGLFIGIISALVALLPVLKSPGTQVPYPALILTIITITISGIIWIWAATSIALSGKVLDTLRSE